MSSVVLAKPGIDLAGHRRERRRLQRAVHNSA